MRRTTKALGFSRLGTGIRTQYGIAHMTAAQSTVTVQLDYKVDPSNSIIEHLGQMTGASSETDFGWFELGADGITVTATRITFGAGYAWDGSFCVTTFPEGMLVGPPEPWSITFGSGIVTNTATLARNVVKARAKLAIKGYTITLDSTTYDTYRVTLTNDNTVTAVRGTDGGVARPMVVYGSAYEFS